MKIKELIFRYRLPAFLIGVILLAFIMVYISVQVYYASGTYQLDLSRPEYMSVREQIEREPGIQGMFEAQGTIDEEVLADFLERFKAEADRAVQADAYGNDVLSDEQLGL